MQIDKNPPKGIIDIYRKIQCKQTRMCRCGWIKVVHYVRRRKAFVLLVLN
jgi:hypothetical protein